MPEHPCSTSGSALPAVPSTRKRPSDHILLDYPISEETFVTNRYSFYHDLGSGAYGSVKYVKCAKNGRPYAIKLIVKTKVPKDYLRKFVPREVDALKRLSVFDHPNICQMREFFETSQRLYLVSLVSNYTGC